MDRRRDSRRCTPASQAIQAGRHKRHAPDGVLVFGRLPGGASAGAVRCVTSTSSVVAGLPPHVAVLLASGPFENGKLPPDTAA